MVKLSRKSRIKVGLTPGAVIHIGEKKIDKVKIEVFDYDESQCQVHALDRVEDSFPFKESPTITWLDIVGLHDTDVIKKVGSYFNIHLLALEDIVNTDHRPSSEISDSNIIVLLKMITYDAEKLEMDIEQVSFILGPNFVISFQEREGDIFDPLRKRIKEGKGRIRKKGSDYLLYALLDIVIDNYFIVLEKLGDKIEELEDRVFDNPQPEQLHEIHKIKREMIFLRKSVWPLREIIINLIRAEVALIQQSTVAFLQDLYDHTIQVIDTVEAFRDTASGLQDAYLSSISNKTNDVMKVLTIIATIFIPLTFMAGIYGMNFEHMPELKWHWSYLVFWMIIFAVGVLMFSFFRKKRWL